MFQVISECGDLLDLFVVCDTEQEAREVEPIIEYAKAEHEDCERIFIHAKDEQGCIKFVQSTWIEERTSDFEELEHLAALIEALVKRLDARKDGLCWKSRGRFVNAMMEADFLNW